MMLGKLCELADEHAVELRLKTLPFGRKPFPLSAQQLSAWYARHGFAAERRKMTRTPKSVLQVPAAIASGTRY
jgi:hypothetical protein